MKNFLSSTSVRMLQAVVLALLLLIVQSARAADPAGEYDYKIVKGDTMIGLSSRLLKSPADWPKVVRYNRLPNPHYLVPGASLRIPLMLLKDTLAVVAVVHVEGDVKAASSANTAPSVLALGATLAEGAQVTTGKDGYVTLKLQDGSTVRVQSGTQIQVSRLRSYPDAGILESVLRVVAGRVESLVAKLGKDSTTQPRHSVNTRLAAMGVRGTEFRVTMDAQTNETRGEVLEGVVAANAQGAIGEGKRIAAGFGTVVDASSKVADPIALLVAPNVANLPRLLERTVLRFTIPPVTGAKTYRAQIARDREFNSIISEAVFSSAELRFSDVPDGSYYLRVRAIDQLGLEGANATHEFRLKARPEPPLLSAPAAKGKVRSKEVEFKWSENTEAAAYHVQVARDAKFATVVREDQSVRAVQWAADGLPLGEYFWRVASIRKDGDRGPFSDVSGFTLLAPPAIPEPPKMDNKIVSFRWPGEPGQTFEFQMSGDPKFEKLLVQQKLQSPEFNMPRPLEGEYFMRFRAIDPDGFVGPYIPPQRIVVPHIPHEMVFPPRPSY